MDEMAVLRAGDAALKGLGLTDGNMIRLKLMCHGTNLDGYKENLKEIIVNNLVSLSKKLYM